MKKYLFLLFVAINICSLWAHENESPYKLFGDSSIVLKNSKRHNPTNERHNITSSDSCKFLISFSKDSLILASPQGSVIASFKLDNTRMAVFTTIDPKAEEMAWVSPYSFCFGDPINYVDKDGMKPTEYEAAMMAELVYSDDLSINSRYQDLADAKWELSSFPTSIVMNLTSFHQNGLQSALFERTIDGITEYAYVYAGTDSLEDVVQDIAQLVGLSNQYSVAIENARTLSEEIGQDELTFVGHSLGGGEAAAASMATQRAAITFNPAAVSPATKIFYGLRDASNVTNYRTVAPGNGIVRFGGCPVTNLQNNIGLHAPGHTISVPLNNHNSLTAHGIKNFVDFFKPKQ